MEALNESVPDVIVSDINLPEINGYMLLEQIRALPPEQGGEIPAIALTAYAEKIDYEQTRAAGFQRHLQKPLEPNRLFEAIISLVRASN